MVRFVLAPDGTVTPDIKRRLPGRGAWVELSRQSVARAVERRLFTRAFKRPVEASPTLAEEVAELLRRAALERLGMAAKGGYVTAGFEKVRAQLSAGKVRGLAIASDAAADGRSKLQSLAKKACNPHKDGNLVEVFSSAELESTLGRDRVVHVALAPGRPSELFFTDALRYGAYASGERLGASNLDHTDEHLFAGPLTV